LSDAGRAALKGAVLTHAVRNLQPIRLDRATRARLE
jgi:hypothetical protein